MTAEDRVYIAFQGDNAISFWNVETLLADEIIGDEFRQTLPHIERGEVCIIGGGAGPLVSVWMDTTGDGNDITDPALAFAIALGEVSR